MTPTEIPDSAGYRALLESVKRDEKRNPGDHDYRGKLAWIVARAQHYAEKTGLSPETILDGWEKRRDYWYMNYYQDANQPVIDGVKCRVFETLAALRESIGSAGFRCPACDGVTRDAYKCTTGKEDHGKVCDWKVYGLLGHLGKGVTVFVKDAVRCESIFMPVAWEQPKSP